MEPTADASRPNPTSSPPSTSRLDASERTTVSLLLLPVLTIAFFALHAVYQVVLLVRDVTSAIKQLGRRSTNRAPSSFTSLQDLLDAHECPQDAIRVPKHLAVILADVAPSSIRLYVSTLFMRLGRWDAPSSTAELWNEFRGQYKAAVELKHATDIATIIHLARISGVQELSVYTARPLSSSALQALSSALQVGHKTKALLSRQGRPSEEEGTIEIGREEGCWPQYTELRRRGTMAKSRSNSSSPSSPGSPASSDSEAGLSSVDETLASSYTAETEQDSFEATVNIRLGLQRIKKSDGSALQVTLLSQEDGRDRFAELVSQHTRDQARAYFSDILIPDVDSAASSSRRFSSSTLRKAWIAKRQTFTSELTVAHLDKALGEAGYLGEPESLVVFGGKKGLRKLYGFPAWPIRLTDLFYDENMQPKRAYGTHDFVAALKKLGKAQHRYGK